MSASSETRLPAENFRFETDPDDPEWSIWSFADDSRFNSTLGAFRVQAREGKAVVRMTPTRAHSNFGNNVHGGAMMGFIDCALFAAARALRGPGAEGGVTLECSVQFLSSGNVDAPLDAVIEILRETKRLLFMRGLLEQGEGPVASFTGILRKFDGPRR